MKPPPRGTTSFWEQPGAKEALTGVDKDAAPVPHRFDGNSFVIEVRALPRKDGTVLLTDAVEQLERLIAAMLRWPDRSFETELERLHIQLTPPSRPKVTLTFGKTVLYAAASSTDKELAVIRAIDRLAMALDLASQDARGKALTLEHSVTIRRKL